MLELPPPTGTESRGNPDTVSAYVWKEVGMESTSKSTIAGLLDIGAGVFAVVGALVLVLLAVVGTLAVGCAPDVPEGLWSIPLLFFGGIAVMIVVPGVVSIIGGVAALRRSSWCWAVTGAMAALVAFAPLGLVSLVLTAMAEPELRVMDERSGD